MNFDKTLINSDDCELLIAFEQGKTIVKTSELLSKDASGVSRQLMRIAQVCPALEKIDGKWVLTEMGKQLAALSREFIQNQKQLASKKIVLKIGTNREFASRILGPNILELMEIFPSTYLSIYAFESGTESALLSGKVDIGIDCEKPNDPDIGFNMVLPEAIVAVSTPSFKKKYLKKIKAKLWQDLPHLLCERLYPHRMTTTINKVDIVAYFNDIATTRAACMNGAGWALLPKYSIQEELDNGSLVLLKKDSWGESRYGVWWSRKRYKNKETIEKLCTWLRSQEI